MAYCIIADLARRSRTADDEHDDALARLSNATKIEHRASEKSKALRQRLAEQLLRLENKPTHLTLDGHTYFVQYDLSGQTGKPIAWLVKINPLEVA